MHAIYFQTALDEMLMPSPSPAAKLRYPIASGIQLYHPRHLGRLV